MIMTVFKPDRAIQTATGLVAAAALSWGLTLPAQAQSCQALPVVGGQGTDVEKTISTPSLGVFRNNWDTDFAAADIPAQRYIASIEAEDGGEYSIEMYLKYADGTADEVYNDIVGLSVGETLEISGTRRLSDQPYQINLSVGGISAVGNAYEASVVACS